MSKTKGKKGKKGKIYRIELTPLSAMLWSIFIFFFLTWIFVLGILVGRGFLPGTVTKISDLKKQIHRLQNLVSDKEAYTSRPQEEQDTDLKLDFFQELISKKDEVKKKTPPLEAKSGETPLTDQEEEKTTEPEKRDPMSFAPGDQYTVQLASLGEMGQAEKMIKKLMDMGYDAYYYEAIVEGKTYYRIRCGRFMEREDALLYARKIEKETGLKGFVSKVE
jgi:hypothetical protein